MAKVKQRQPKNPTEEVQKLKSRKCNNPKEPTQEKTQSKKSTRKRCELKKKLTWKHWEETANR